MAMNGKMAGKLAVVMACLLAPLAAGAKETNPAGAMAEKYDTKLPVEISADSLEVLQKDNKAIFKGHVIAVQGKIRLTSDKMVVHYKQDGQKGKDAKAAHVKPSSSGGAGTPGAMGAITLIEVEGNVFMATPEESAKGEKGDYQVPEKMLHLSGGNVILTRDKNILRGTSLVYNLETGHSVLTNKGGAASGVNGGRVHGLFIPNSEQGKGKEKTDGTKSEGVSVTAPAASTEPATGR
jgi:lipopolysaccharide export system protein LptA